MLLYCGALGALTDEHTLETHAPLTQARDCGDEHVMTLVGLQARDAHDAERFTSRRSVDRGDEALGVHATTNDHELLPRSLAELPHQVLTVEGRDDCNERRGRELLLEHGPVDEDVVCVGGEAERHTGQAVHDVRGERGMGRPVRMHVLHARAVSLPRKPRSLGNDDPRAQEKPR